MILGLETSGRSGSAALCFSSGDIITKFTAESEGSAKSLAPVIFELFRQTQLKPNCLEAIAVTIGPGSFTGLRVGVALAKAMAYGLGIPVIGVNTLEALAFDFQSWNRLMSQESSAYPDFPSDSKGCWRGQSDSFEFWTVLDAYRGEFFVAKWKLLSEPKGPEEVLADKALTSLLSSQIIPKQKWHDMALAQDPMLERTIVVGPGSEKLLAGAQNSLGKNLQQTREQTDTLQTIALGSVDSYPQIIPTAASVAALGWRKWGLGECVSPMELMPLYLRGSAAEEKKRSGDCTLKS